MGRSRASYPRIGSTMRHSNNNGILPWVVMGLSVGVGYFGLESLMEWHSTRTRDAIQSANMRKKSPFHQQLIRHFERMKSLLSFGDAKAWLLRFGTIPLLGGYHDLFWGVFVTVLPTAEAQPQPSEARVLANPLPSKSRSIKPSSTPEAESDIFLSLPPQLNPRLPPIFPKLNPASAPKKERYLEMMLHNISHTDLVIGLDVLPQGKNSKPSSLNAMCLGRPRFSAFDMYCRKLLKALDGKTNREEAEIVLVPQYQRAQNDPRYTIQPSHRPHVSTGFCWKTDPANLKKEKNNPRVIPLTEVLADLRVRGKDIAKLDPDMDNSNSNSSSNSSNKSSERAASPAAESWNMVLPEQPASSATVTTVMNKEDILVELKAIFFPLLATLLPRWHAQIAQKYSKQSSQTDIHKVLVLVTGVGTPRNWTHSITGNSTQAVADLMELYLAKVYPDITVVKIHSGTNIFRYDDNILFVQRELMPTVNAYRDAHATQAPYPHEVLNKDDMLPTIEGGGFLQQLQPQSGSRTASFDVDWKKSFAVTLSFADGSPARTHAIQTALRIYRPTYFHIWQLKTFWHERKIVDDDVEVHSFEEMETSPALESRDIQGELALVVQEMKAFRDEMVETLMGKKDASDIHSFWLRKTHKPVLAVLLVQSAGGPPILYRGTNMEVSMPTGSLCAERNVIGTALASNPKLKREDLKCVAVLAVPQPSKKAALGPPPRPPRAASDGNNLDTCGSCRSSRQNSMDESNNNNATTMTGQQIRKQSFDEREEDWMLSYGSEKQQRPKSDAENAATHEGRPKSEPSTPIKRISLFSSESSNSLVDMIKQNPNSGASPRADLVQGAKEKRTVIVRSNNTDIDLNPLKPCGACHEWLKKIAECNPYFQILTFTDADCTGVYVTPCQE